MNLSKFQKDKLYCVYTQCYMQLKVKLGDWGAVKTQTGIPGSHWSMEFFSDRCGLK